MLLTVRRGQQDRRIPIPAPWPPRHIGQRSADALRQHMLDVNPVAGAPEPFPRSRNAGANTSVHADTTDLIDRDGADASTDRPDPRGGR